MRSYTTYVCGVCGAESRDISQIELCEGKHLGLVTLDEVREHQRLRRAFNDASRALGSAQNPVLLDAQDAALSALMKFESEKGICGGDGSGK